MCTYVYIYVYMREIKIQMYTYKYIQAYTHINIYRHTLEILWPQFQNITIKRISQ